MRDDDLLRPAARRPREQHVVGGPIRVRRIIEAGDHRLERADVDARGAKPGDHRAREDGFADAGVGAGDEQAAGAPGGVRRPAGARGDARGRAGRGCASLRGAGGLGLGLDVEGPRVVDPVAGRAEPRRMRGRPDR